MALPDGRRDYKIEKEDQGLCDVFSPSSQAVCFPSISEVTSIGKKTLPLNPRERHTIYYGGEKGEACQFTYLSLSFQESREKSKNKPVLGILVF